MSKIFLSFTTSDTNTVDFFEQTLSSAGHEVFRFDHGGLKIGDPSDQIISERIRDYDYIFVFLSQAYIKRPYTIKELNQTVYAENSIGKIKMIIVNIDVDRKDYPRILNSAPGVLKNRFCFNASDGISSPNQLAELLKRVSEPNTIFESLYCYCLKLAKDGLKIYHRGEKYDWKRDILDLLFFEGVGVYFLLGISEKGLEFKNYLQLTDLEYNPNEYTKMFMDANLRGSGSEVRYLTDGSRVRNVYILDCNYPQRENGEYTNNVWS